MKIHNSWVWQTTQTCAVASLSPMLKCFSFFSTFFHFSSSLPSFVSFKWGGFRVEKQSSSSNFTWKQYGWLAKFVVFFFLDKNSFSMRTRAGAQVDEDLYLMSVESIEVFRHRCAPAQRSCFMHDHSNLIILAVFFCMQINSTKRMPASASDRVSRVALEIFRSLSCALSSQLEATATATLALSTILMLFHEMNFDSLWSFTFHFSSPAHTTGERAREKMSSVGGREGEVEPCAAGLTVIYCAIKMALVELANDDDDG